MNEKSKWDSRKLVVTGYVLLATTVLAYLKAMTPEVAGVFTGLGVAYVASQGYVDGKNSD